MSEWVEWKAYALKTGDFSHYLWLLKEMQKTFGKLYGELINEPDRKKTIELLEKMLKLISCEIKETNIKYKGKK